MNLFQLGDCTLASGAKSRWKLECDALTGEDWKALAAMVAQLVGPFSSVEGVPRGGLPLAEALQLYRGFGLAGPHLIVDDVMTSGESIGRARTAVMRSGAAWIIGAVVFARGPLVPWVKSVFQMPEVLWANPLQRGAP